ncbi:MAG: hypothetical protein IKJ78_04185 [Bacteroidales bacterium]|nr:hypothetical protein [Bacteroidales bacterium]
MKVRFVWMTPSKGLMVHLVPDIMLIPTESSFAIVAGWLNMHLSFKFKKRQKTEKDTIKYKFSELHNATQGLKKEIGKTRLGLTASEILNAMSNLGKAIKEVNNE